MLRSLLCIATLVVCATVVSDAQARGFGWFARRSASSCPNGQCSTVYACPNGECAVATVEEAPKAEVASTAAEPAQAEVAPVEPAPVTNVYPTYTVRRFGLFSRRFR